MNAHPTREEDFDLYALGVLEGDELGEIEAHVSGCAQCTAKLAEARARVALLSFAAPQVAPAAGVRAGLLARIHAEAKHPADVAPTAESYPARSSAASASRWWQMILVPAVAALAVATVVLWQQNARLDRELALLHAGVTRQQVELNDARQLAALIGSSDTVTVSLAEQPGMPRGAAHVMYNMKMGMLLYDGQLPAAPPDKSYQLWVVPAQGNPINAGVFNPVPGQADHWVMKMPEGMVPKAFAITIEPTGGMPQPTGPKVLVGLAS